MTLKAAREAARLSARKIQKTAETNVRARGRVDVALGLGLAVVLTVGAAVGGAVALWEARTGFLDPPALRPIPDRRILANLRDPEHVSPFADMAIDAAGRALVAARRDGTVHVFDLDLRLFGEERIGGDALTGGIDTLSAGCGSTGAVSGCPDDSVYALTDRGGLAARRDGAWEVLIGDRGWAAADGSPVSDEDVETWALTTSGRWLLASAGAKGAAIFDTAAADWVRLSAEAVRPLAPGAAGLHIEAIGERFWIGGAEGLFTLDAEAGARTPSRVAGIAGEVLDLTPDTAGGLLALTSSPCPGGACLAIHAVDGRAAARRLIGEDNYEPALSGASLSHAALQAGRVVALGEPGIRVYDPAKRGWSRLADGAVDAHSSAPDGTLTAAIGSRIVTLRNAAIVAETELPGRAVRQLAGLPDGRIFALTAAGDIVETGTGEVVFASAEPSIAIADATRAAAVETIVLALAEAGAVVHDIRTRRFAAVPAALLPPPLVREGVSLHAAAGRFWAVERATGTVWLLAVTTDLPDVAVSLADQTGLEATIADVTASDDGLMATTDAGIVHRLVSTADGIQTSRQIGDGRAAPGTIRLLAPVAGGLTVSDGVALWTYDTERRSWRDRPPAVLPGERIAAIGSEPSTPPGRELLVTGTGRLLALEANGAVDLLGGGPGAPFSSAALTDAFGADGAVLLGGDGQVVRYSPRTRSFDALWTGGAGPVEIAGMIGDDPVWLSGGTLRHGGRVLTEDGLDISKAWIEGTAVVGVARAGGTETLVRIDRGRGGRGVQCFFRQPSPRGEDLIDARELPDGRIAVQTEAGLAIYDPESARWYDTSDREPASGSVRLFSFGAGLIRTRPGRIDVLERIGRAASCAESPLKVEWRIHQSRSVAVDERTGRLAVLSGDGAVRLAEAGRPGFREVLPPASEGPAPAELQRVYADRDELLFTSATGIWRYDLVTRGWTRAGLAGLPGPPDATDLVPGTAGGWAATALVGGTAWGADLADTGAELAFTSAVPPAITRFPYDPAALVDIAEAGDGRWLVLLDDRIAVFEPAADRWSEGLTLPSARRDRRLMRWDGILAVVDGPADAPERYWLLPEGALEQPGTLSAAAFAYDPARDRGAAVSATERRLYRLSPDGALRACPIATGASADSGCGDIAEASIAVPADALGMVYRIGPGTYLAQIGDGWVTLDPASRQMAALALPDPRLARPDRVFLHNGALHLWVRGGPLARLGPGGAFDLLASKVDLIGQDAAGRVWLADGARIAPLDAISEAGNGSVARSLSAQGSLLALTPAGDVTEDGAIILSGYAPTGHEIALDRGRMPTQGETAADGIWVQSDSGEMKFRAVVPCDGAPGSCDTVLARFESPLADGGFAIFRRAQVTPEGVVLRFDGFTVRLDPEGRPGAPEPDTTPAWDMPAWAPDEREMLLSEAVTLGDQTLLAPARIAALSGRLMISAGHARFSVPGTLGAEPLPAADAGWLGWDRAAHQFRVGLAGSDIGLAPEAALEGGRFLWAAPGIDQYLGRGSWLITNRHGRWRMDETGRVTLAEPEALPEPVGLDHGRVVFADGTEATAGEVPQPSGTPYRTTVGDLTLAELPGGGVAATARVSGQEIDAWADTGFVFDRRIAVGWDGVRLAIVTPFGVLGPDQLDRFDALPAGGTDEILSVDGRLLARQGGRFLAFGDGGWTEVADPTGEWTMVAGSRWLWRARAGRREIVPTRPEDAWRTARTGLRFDADVLIGAAGTGNRTALTTGVGLASGSDLGALIAARPPDPDAPPRARPRALRDGSGEPVLWAETPSARLVYDGDTWRAAPVGAAPWESRVAHSGGGIEIHFAAGRAHVAAEVRMADGTRRWASFDWQSGERFPFDHALDVAVDGDRIFAATRFGVHELRRTDLGAVTVALHDPGNGQGAAAPVARIGRPTDAPGLIVAHTNDGCLDLTAQGACRAEGHGAADLILASGLWRWTREGGRLRGTYRDHAGNDIPGAIPLDGAHWPHDRIVSAVVCAGVRAEVWADGTVVALRTSQGPALYHDASGDLTRLICIDRDRPLGRGAALAAGLYSLGREVRRFAGGWNPVPAPAAGAARESAAYPVYRQRLRQITGPEGTRFEIRTLDDTWHPLPMDGTVTALDRTLGIAVADDRLWRLTPMGFAALAPAGQGRGHDPDALVIATAPEGLDGCKPDRLGAFADRTALRCRDGRVFSSLLDGSRDRDALARTDDDPFAEVTLIDEPGLWTWRRLDPVAGQPGSIAIAFRGEPITLAGRLSVDAIRQIAVSADGRIDTLGPDGWWQSRREAPGLGQTRRPEDAGIDPRAADLLTPTDSAGPGICVRAGGRRAEIGADSRAVPTCQRRLGSDGLWTYLSGEAGVVAHARSRGGGQVRRRLDDGRFRDLVVTGPPLADADLSGGLLLPTRDGFTVLDRDGRAHAVIASGSGALAVPGSDGKALILDAATVLPHCPAFPMDDRPDTVLATAEGFELAWGGGTTRTRAHLACARGTPRLTWGAILDLRDRVRSHALQAGGASVNGDLVVRLDGTDLAAADGSVSAVLGKIQRPLRLIADPRSARIYVLTADEIFEVDGDATLSALHREAGQ